MLKNGASKDMGDVKFLIQESYKLWKENKLDESAVLCERALELEPNNVMALVNLAASWGAREGATKRVRELVNRAYALDPTQISVLQNLAAISLDDCDYQKSLEYHDKILEQQPLHSDILASKGRILLTLGNLKEGFELTEHGLGIPDGRGSFQPFSKAAWRGQYCNKLLLTWEQGMGDCIQFIRYAELCKKRVNKVYFLCPLELKGLLETCPWIDACVQRICENEFDEHISLMSLPVVFGTTIETIPATVPYLYARKSKVEARPLISDKLKVGLVWAGNPRPHHTKANLTDRKRSITFDHYKPLLGIKGIEFYNLQYGEPPQEGIVNFDHIKDFSDSAAIIAQLDLLITVDTAPAHVAGAMNIPVWVLSRFSGCWRWLTGRNDSPWYPALRLFRQPKESDWDSVMKEVEDSLGKMVLQK